MIKNNQLKINPLSLNAPIIPRGSNKCSKCKRTSLILYGTKCEECLILEGSWKK